MWNRINNKSISFQLTLVISLFLVIAFTSIATLVYKNASEVLLEQTMQEHQSKLDALAETISGEFENFLGNAHELEAAFRNGYMYDLSFDNETHNFAGYQVKDATVHGKSVINNSTIADNFTADTGAIATLFLASGNDYIRVATSLKNENGKRALGTMLGQNHPGYHSLKNGQPYYAKVDLFGHPYLTYYHPIKDSTGQVRALSFVGLPIEAATKAIFSTLSKIKWGDTGYTIVTDNDKARLGVYLYHPGNKKEGSSIIDYQDPEGNRPFGKAFEQKNGLIKYSFDVNGDTYEKYLVYAEIPGWNWKLFGGTYISEVTKGSQELLTVIIITSFVVGLLSLAVLSLFLKKKTQPLTTLAGYMDRLGDGEVSLSMEQGKRDSDNEIERLTYGVSSMAMKLNTLVGNIRSTSGSVQQQADIVSNEAGASLKQSEVQQEQVELVVTAIEEMASSAQSVAEQVENIATTVRSANEDSQSGSAVVGQMTTQIAELNEQLRQSADAIEMVNHESENIQTVTRMIDEIAEQTNLLALNAAIEAARAGEQGRGFAVVADEVRNLAHRTQESVKEVVKIIDQLRVSTSSAVAMMSESQSKGESVTQQATRTGEALDNITSQVMEIAAQSEAIAATSEEQAQVSQEIAASATQISNLNRDSHANAVQTESSATNLQKLSVNLTEQVAYFR